MQRWRHRTPAGIHGTKTLERLARTPPTRTAARRRVPALRVARVDWPTARVLAVWQRPPDASSAYCGPFVRGSLLPLNHSSRIANPKSFKPRGIVATVHRLGSSEKVGWPAK